MTVLSRRALPGLAVFCCALLGGPVAAVAHAILVDSRPAAGASVAAGHVDLRLRFNSRIDASRSRLTLTGPGHSQAVLAATGTEAGNMLTSSVELTPGAYSLRWQVLAIDGHITRGDVTFTVTGN